ncbi:DNA primase [Anaeromyxobacter oryzae]|uniref:DNA primase n=1 Tax=Anaeromyxobacter oryzae TaxID=2918170 RepID=UPI0020C16E60|nr:DNA primase [Anaeromyxobacter oryzae]
MIGRHMELKRSGRTWKGNCVFHGEKTPSFHVYPEDKHFKCYGCGEHGDVFTFLQKLEGKEFPEVVRALALEVGVEIPEAAEEDSAEQRARRKERNEIHSANDAGARYFAARLGSRFGDPARAYLAGRGVSEDSIRRFRLGVAADAWNDLPRRLAEKGIGLEALKKAGLVIEREKDGGTYDRFRNRLMFPIAGMDGQVIGFGGRALGDEKGAKYLNTPETPLYKKSRVLYGLDLARETIRKTRQALLVEGYFDVIGLHQAGITNAVAVCGTALTPEHVELLGRCDCREVTILFDGDAAGLAAPAKAAQALFPAGLAGKVAVLPSDAGKTDPDDYARAHGRAGVEALLAKAAPLSAFLIDRAIDRTCAGRPREAALEQKLAAVRELSPFVRMMPEGLARSVFEDAIAKRLDLDPAALHAELSGEKPHPPPRPEPAVARPGPAPRPARPVGGGDARMRLLLPGPAADALGILAAHPELGPVADEEGLPRLLPPGPLAELARELCRGPVAVDEALARLAAAGADEAATRRIRALTGPARPKPEEAERELRKAAVKATIEAVRGEQDRLLAEIAKRGAPVPEDLAVAAQVAARRRSDLEKRLRSLERPG